MTTRVTTGVPTRKVGAAELASLNYDNLEPSERKLVL
jgi:hypothetical protein